MKHYILISVISILSLLAIASNSARLISASPQRNIEDEQTERMTTYVLMDYNGRIALFEGDNEKPIVVYEIFTSSLPQADQESLIKGISVHSQDEINRLIEEYTS